MSLSGALPSSLPGPLHPIHPQPSPHHTAFLYRLILLHHLSRHLHLFTCPITFTFSPVPSPVHLSHTFTCSPIPPPSPVYLSLTTCPITVICLPVHYLTALMSPVPLNTCAHLSRPHAATHPPPLDRLSLTGGRVIAPPHPTRLQLLITRNILGNGIKKRTVVFPSWRTWNYFSPTFHSALEVMRTDWNGNGMTTPGGNTTQTRLTDRNGSY